MALDQLPVADPLRQMIPIMDDVHSAIADVVESGRWLKGRQTAAFEEAFAEFVGTDHALGIGNGTDGLELALRAVAVEPGREAITVANAGGYTTSACRIVGGTPVYVDVRDDSLTLDIEAAIGAVTTETAVVVATHLFGNVVDVVALRRGLESIGRPDVGIIEDASQAHGASLRGEPVGSLGDIGVFSFYPTKNLGALGDAGAVVTSDPELFERISALHQYGWVSRYHSELPFGRNSRMDEIQAAVLALKLPHLEDWNAERRAILETYRASVTGSPAIVFVTDAVAGGVAHLAVARTAHREGLRSHLGDLGIGTDVHFPTLDFNQPGQRGLPARRLDLPVSEAAIDEIVTLPCFPGMIDSEVQRVVTALGSFVEAAA